MYLMTVSTERHCSSLHLVLSPVCHAGLIQGRGPLQKAQYVSVCVWEMCACVFILHYHSLNASTMPVSLYLAHMWLAIPHLCLRYRTSYVRTLTSIGSTFSLIIFLQPRIWSDGYLCRVNEVLPLMDGGPWCSPPHPHLTPFSVWVAIIDIHSPMYLDSEATFFYLVLHTYPFYCLESNGTFCM